MAHFRPINRDAGFLMRPSVDEWLPEKHLARFAVEVIARAGGNRHPRPLGCVAYDTVPFNSVR
jgi:hypothetical protein